MISNEEMYEFASQIAGITDSDLQQYKCGGKTKMKKDCGGAKMKLQEGKKVKKNYQDPDDNDEGITPSDLNNTSTPEWRKTVETKNDTVKSEKRKPVAVANGKTYYKYQKKSK